jgi:AcrR family transcriptional regulator
MSQKEDLRVTKTKLAIEKAFLSLLREMPFDKITVQLIANEALVNKGTFYRHYHDKYDLAKQVCDKKLAELGADVASWMDQQSPANSENMSERLMTSLIASLYDEIDDIYTLSLLDIKDVDVMGGLRDIVKRLLGLYPAKGMRPEELETVAWVAVRIAMGYQSYYAEVEDPMNPYDYARLIRETSNLYLSWIPSSTFEAGLRFWEHRG